MKTIKIIKIEYCEECQYMEINNKGEKCCDYSNSMKTIPRGIPIPDWCPLEDYKNE